VQFAATVYDDSQTAWCSLANTLAIYDYLLQHGAYVYTANNMRHMAHYGKTRRHPQNLKYMSSEKGSAMVTRNMYRKFCAVWTCGFFRHVRQTYKQTDRYADMLTAILRTPIGGKVGITET